MSKTPNISNASLSLSSKRNSKRERSNIRSKAEHNNEKLFERFLGICDELRQATDELCKTNEFIYLFILQRGDENVDSSR